MLYIVLVMVLAALGLLVTALTTANTLWAWASVLVSVAAAALLVTDWVRARRARSAATQPPAPDTGSANPVADPVPPAGEKTEQVVKTESPDTAPAAPEDTPVTEDPEAEPAEEATDAADLLVISGLTTEVRVLDERPRYHVTRCTWVGERPTIPLSVAEARQLGFTPCARCTPDAVLAERHRAGRGARQPRP